MQFKFFIYGWVAQAVFAAALIAGFKDNILCGSAIVKQCNLGLERLMEYHHLAEIGVMFQVTLRHIQLADLGGPGFDVEADLVALQIIAGRHFKICRQCARIAYAHLKAKSLIRGQEFGLGGSA